MNDAWQHSHIGLGLSNELIQGTNPNITHMDKWTQAYWFCACSLAALAPPRQGSLQEPFHALHPLLALDRLQFRVEFYPLDQSDQA